MFQHFNDYSYGFHAGGFGPFFLLPIFVLWFAITLALKGYSLWHAAKRAEKWWFITLLVLNTAGLLELFYIVFILKKFPTRVKKGHHEETK